MGKVSNSGRTGVRSFSKTGTPKSTAKYIGKPLAKPRTVSTSARYSKYSRHSVSYTYTRPVRFYNPYLTYYLLTQGNNGYYPNQPAVVDTNAFPGFGNGKSGGAGASVSNIGTGKMVDTLDVAELQPINYLSDYAQIIPDNDEPRINSMIRQYKKLTGIEIAILTVPTLGDEIDIDSYTQVIFDQWGIGEAGENNGILIVISSVDELLRLQPGYGLEELLTDADSRHIEDTYMVPLFNFQIVCLVSCIIVTRILPFSIITECRIILET